jgi:hypothetical protein
MNLSAIFANPATIAIIATFGFLTICSVTHYVYKGVCHTQLIRLKERLLEAGMSSAEIERVVRAGTSEIDENFVPAKKQPI